METERIELSQRERDRLKVLHEVERRAFEASRSGAAAAVERPSGAAVGSCAARGGRSGGCCIGCADGPRTARCPELRAAASARLRQPAMPVSDPRWPPSIWRVDGLVVSRETLRKWMTAAGLWRPRQRRETHACVAPAAQLRGELVMLDSSPFRWLEEPRPGLPFDRDDR